MYIHDNIRTRLLVHGAAPMAIIKVHTRPFITIICLLAHNHLKAIVGLRCRDRHLTDIFLFHASFLALALALFIYY